MRVVPVLIPAMLVAVNCTCFVALDNDPKAPVAKVKVAMFDAKLQVTPETGVAQEIFA